MILDNRYFITSREFSNKAHQELAGNLHPNSYENWQPTELPELPESTKQALRAVEILFDKLAPLASGTE